MVHYAFWSLLSTLGRGLSEELVALDGRVISAPISLSLSEDEMLMIPFALLGG